MSLLRLDYFSRDQVKALQFLEYDLDAQDAHAEKPDMSHRVEQFVEKHAVDEDCGKLLRAQSQAVAYEVLVDFTKELATAPQLHSDRSTFSAEVTELIERHAEESPLLDVFVDINGLSPDFARLLRLQPRKVQEEVINNLDDYAEGVNESGNRKAGRDAWFRLRQAWYERAVRNPKYKVQKQRTCTQI